MQPSPVKVSRLSLLGILFIGLKLTGFIAWSWLWVLAPFWLGLAILAVFALMALLIFILSVFSE